MLNLPLTPILNDWIKKLISPTYQTALFEVVEKYGSPVNILHLDSFLENVNAYNQVFKDLQLDGKCFYARKANKCLTLLKRTRENSYGIDTASLNELRQSLSAGVQTKDIVLTAAIKTEALIEEAINHQVLIILDNEDELQTISKVADQLGKTAIIGVRISGFEVNGEKLYSRFGIDIDSVLEFITDKVQNNSNVIFRGLHFHLDGYSIEQRRSALIDCLELAVKINNVTFIDIGGGLLMNYLKDANEWRTFDQYLRASLLPGGEEITYKNNGLGYEKYGSEIIGSLKTYPYYNEVNGGEALRIILQGEPADKLRELGIQIRMEPGRSLLKQVGITVARVVHRKTDSKGEVHVGLEMNMTQMLSGSRDFLVDPIVINQKKKNEESVGVYFTGAYCLERDVLLKRRIGLERLPDIGDLVVFPNTAGYMMHFFESEAHQFPLANNVFVKIENGELSAELDAIDNKFEKVLHIQER